MVEKFSIPVKNKTSFFIIASLLFLSKNLEKEKKIKSWKSQNTEVRISHHKKKKLSKKKMKHSACDLIENLKVGS